MPRSFSAVEISPAPCPKILRLFDGPNDVKPAKVEQTVKKLGDVVKAELLAMAERRAEMLGRAEARHLPRRNVLLA